MQRINATFDATVEGRMGPVHHPPDVPMFQRVEVGSRSRRVRIAYHFQRVRYPASRFMRSKKPEAMSRIIHVRAVTVPVKGTRCVPYRAHHLFLHRCIHRVDRQTKPSAYCRFGRKVLSLWPYCRHSFSGENTGKYPSDAGSAQIRKCRHARRSLGGKHLCVSIIARSAP